MSSWASDAAKTPIAPTRVACAACALASSSPCCAASRASTLASTSPSSTIRTTSASGQSRCSCTIANESAQSTVPENTTGTITSDCTPSAQSAGTSAAASIGRSAGLVEANDRAAHDLRTDPGYVDAFALNRGGRYARGQPAMPLPELEAAPDALPERRPLGGEDECHVAQARLDHAVPVPRMVGREQGGQHLGHQALEIHRRVERLPRALVCEGIAEDVCNDAKPGDDLGRPVTLVPERGKGDRPFDSPIDGHGHGDV